MDTPPSKNALRRVAALLEVLGVYLAGGLVTSWVVRALHLRVTNPLPEFRVDITDAALLTASWQLGMLLLLQYAGWFLLIIPLSAWHRRRGPAAFGLTRAGSSWTALALAGLGTLMLAYGPALGINLLDTFHDLGETVAWRQAFFDTSWRRWEFWLFSGVASWALVACLEELFFRGYCQRRLAEEWGDAPAIVGVTCLFLFAHSQYLGLSAYNLGMVFSLACLAIGFGVVFAVTRSLVPSMITHVLINVPMTPLWQGVTLGACVLVTLIAWRRGRDYVRRAFSAAPVPACLLLGLAGAAWPVAARRWDALPYVAVGMVLAAVALHVIARRRNSGSPASRVPARREANPAG